MDEGARSRTRIHHINIYGIDDRFWQFHALQVAPFREQRGAFVGATLARQLSVAEGDALILQIEAQQAIPKEWLYGQRDDFRKSIRLSCESILPSEKLGDFSLRPSQGEVYSLFVPLSRLQKDLDLPSDANIILLSNLKNGGDSDIRQTLAMNLTLSDLGLRLKDIPSGKGFILESNRILIGDRSAQPAMDVAKELGLPFSPVYTYMANSIRAGGRSIPYSAITAADIGDGALVDIQPQRTGAAPKPDSPLPPITLTDWASRDLDVEVGETVEVVYYIWQDAGDLATRSASFTLNGTVPIKGSVHTSLAPEIPGITESASMTSWDPPFPMDLELIREKDEQYWERYRATPKAFIPLSVGQQLWKSRFGELTSIRFTVGADADPDVTKAVFSGTFLNRSAPESSGITIRRTRETGKESSGGSTDFGEYFLYFSFFLIVSSILLSVLFFKLTVEQRIKDLGYLKVAGFTPGRLQRLFLGEGLILSVIGSAAGVVLSLFYGYLMVYGLRTWWVGAVGTTRLSLHIS
ncbi:MAG: ABC transporter permease, partial [Acidobacteriota bacterium]